MRDVDLRLARGTVCGLLGPSGCGKTTLMRAIVGVQRDVRGRVDVLGAPAGSASLRPRVGYVTQAPAVYGDLTVAENLRFFARVLNAPRRREAEVTELVGLAGASAQLVRALSGGQRARVSLATALVGKPELLVLDEPTVGLDPVLRRDLWGTFHELASEGVSLLVSSHVMDEAERCDRARPHARRTRPHPGDTGRAPRADGDTGRRARVPAPGGVGMSARVTFAIAVRVLAQLRRDPRTIALLILVPCVLVTLVRYVVDRDVALFQRVGVPLVGLFPLISMFLVTSITMLRERSSGTLERLLTLPLSRLDILLGYAIAFAGVAAAQTAAVSIVAFGALGLDSNGPLALVVAFALLNALLGMALGLFVSAFATTEFQAVQFLPAFLLPQLLLCGLLVPRDGMTPVLRWLSNVLPMTYAYDALHRVAIDGTSRRLAVDAIVLGGCVLAALAAGAVTLRRRTA